LIHSGGGAALKRHLDKLTKKEIEIAESIKESAGEETRVGDFFPEFREWLVPPFANSLDPILKIPTLLPFYQTLIVGISPFRDIDSFQNNYGLSLSTMLELAQQRRLLFILNGYPKDYANLTYPTFRRTRDVI